MNSLGQEARSGWSDRVARGVIAGILTNVINCAVLRLARPIGDAFLFFVLVSSFFAMCVGFVIHGRGTR